MIEGLGSEEKKGDREGKVGKGRKENSEVSRGDKRSRGGVGRCV